MFLQLHELAYVRGMDATLLLCGMTDTCAPACARRRISGRRFSHKRTFIFAMKTKNKYHTLKFEFGSMLK